ncbi:MAG: TVP38/TMEM64 family protein [Phycisphaerales bacterium]
MPELTTQPAVDPNAAATTSSTARETLRQLGPSAILAAFWAAGPAILGGLLLIYLGAVADFLIGMGPWGWLLYAVMFMVSAGVGFLPTYGQSVLGGWTFGFWLGFPGAMLGFVGGSVIGYFIAHGVSKDKVERVISANPKSRAVRDALVGRGFWRTVGTVTLVRIPPNSPFAITNLVMASAGVRFWPYFIGTAVGMAPRTAVAVYAAHYARHLSDPPAKDLLEFIKSTPWQVTVGGAVSLVVVMMILVYIGNKALAQVAKNDKPAAPSPPAA